MKIVSTRAFATALLLGVAGAGFAAPALAKDKNPPAGPSMTAAVRNALAAVDTALAANDMATAAAQLQAAQAAAQTDDDRYYLARTRYNYEVRRANAHANTPADLANAATPLIENPRTPDAERAQLLYQRGNVYYDAGQRQQALADLTRAKQLGYSNPELDLRMIQSRVDTGDVTGGLQSLRTVVEAQRAAGQRPPETYYRYAIGKASAAHLQPQLAYWLAQWAQAYPSPTTWHDAVILTGLQGTPSTPVQYLQHVDLWRVAAATHAIADQDDYLVYINNALSAGRPWDAKAALAQANAQGKLQTTTIENAGLLKRINLAIAAAGSQASLDAKAQGSGAAALLAGDAYYGSGNYARAAEMYRLALQKGADASRANLDLGAALVQAGDKAGARAALAAVAPGTPEGNAAQLWMALAA